MSLLVTFLYIVLCVLLFALAILVHEFGHFIVALKLGLRVEAFSIGFGPVLWKKTVNGVEYRLSSIPLGGYVSIPDVDPEGTKALEGVSTKDAPQPRARIPAWKELLVAVAGPFMNIVLAFVLAVILSLCPSAKFGELSSLVGGVIPDGPADKAGLRAGDRITAVDGHAVSTWAAMQTEILIAGAREVPLTVARAGEGEVTLRVTPQRDEVSGMFFIQALSTTNMAHVALWMPSRNPLRQLAWDAGSIFRVLKGLVTPKEAKATSQALGGPVVIAEGLYRQVRRDPLDGLGFLRFLNVNLAILNLLPIPVLDGGLILFALIALVFRRRVPDVIVKNSSLVFMVLLMGLMALLIFRDTVRTYRIHTYEPHAEREAPTHGTDDENR